MFCSPNNMNCSTCVLSNQGFVYEFTFTTAGNFSYFCCVHCAFGMIGAVNVSAASPTPTPMATATPTATSTPMATATPTPTPTATPPAVADGCFPNFTTAEGCDALSLLTTGAGNTALGWRSLFLDTTGSFNT